MTTKQSCPIEGCDGKLYRVKPSKVVKFYGQQLFTAKELERERFRCNLCLEYFTANPPDVDANQQCSHSARTIIALQKYYLGTPFYRLQSFQSIVNLPLSDSVQWDWVEKLGNIVYPVFLKMKALAANMDLVVHDDTRVRILDYILENQRSNPDRKGMFTTGAVFHKKDQHLVLFASSRKHSGENLKEFLTPRFQDLPPIKQMSDALSANNVKGISTQHGLCWSHVRRKLIEVEHLYPEVCAHLVLLIDYVYGIERSIASKSLDASSRLEFHQELSGPILEHFLEEIEFLCSSIKPNAPLIKVFDYILKNWKGLTLFLEVPGLPLDSNEAERTLKIPIRHRKNSLFYKSEHSAHIADVLMSLIYTCVLNEVNPYDYLNFLQLNAKSLREHPAQFLPWTWLHCLPKAA